MVTCLHLAMRIVSAHQVNFCTDSQPPFHFMPSRGTAAPTITTLTDPPYRNPAVPGPHHEFEGMHYLVLVMHLDRMLDTAIWIWVSISAPVLINFGSSSRNYDDHSPQRN